MVNTKKNIMLCIILIVLILFIIGCGKKDVAQIQARIIEDVNAQDTQKEPVKEFKLPDYKFLSWEDYNQSRCESTGYLYKEDGFNTGIKVILKDKITKEHVDGYAISKTKYGGKSIGLEKYSCEEGADSKKMLVSAYAKGYAPSVVLINLRENQMAQVEILMSKTCKSKENYFDTLKTSALIFDDISVSKEYVTEQQTRIYDIINEQFNLTKSDYTLNCIESNDGRGGYIKANGTYKDKTYFELYFKSGWCSSGGTDCINERCFNSTSKILNLAANATGKNCLTR